MPISMAKSSGRMPACNDASVAGGERHCLAHQNSDAQGATQRRMLNQSLIWTHLASQNVPTQMANRSIRWPTVVLAVLDAATALAFLRSYDERQHVELDSSAAHERLKRRLRLLEKPFEQFVGEYAAERPHAGAFGSTPAHRSSRIAAFPRGARPRQSRCPTRGRSHAAVCHPRG